MKNSMKDESFRFQCRLCGGEVISRNWGGGECAICGSISVTTIPTEMELKEFYQRFNGLFRVCSG